MKMAKRKSSKKPSKSSLEKKTKKQLIDYAKSKGLAYRKMNKADLIDSIIAGKKAPAPKGKPRTKWTVAMVKKEMTKLGMDYDPARVKPEFVSFYAKKIRAKRRKLAKLKAA